MAKPTTRYHRDFADPSADIVLRSSDGKLFRIHSIILKLGSSFFHDMFEVAYSDDAPIDMSHDAVTVHGLLSLIHPGAPMPSLNSIDRVHRILHAAEMYGMPGPVSTIKTLFESRDSLFDDPLRVYTIARNRGWNDVANAASFRTLNLDLLDPALISSMQGMAVADFLMLLRLRQSRKEKLLKELEKNDWGSLIYDHFRESKQWFGQSSAEWKALKDHIIAEITRNPLGETLSVAEFIGCPEAEACWAYQVEVRSGRSQARTHNAFKSAIVSKRLQDIIEALPKTVGLLSEGDETKQSVVVG